MIECNSVQHGLILPSQFVNSQQIRENPVAWNLAWVIKTLASGMRNSKYKKKFREEQPIAYVYRSKFNSILQETGDFGGGKY